MKIQCPNCNQYKGIKQRKVYFWAGFIFALLSLPWVFILIGIPFLIAGVLLSIAAFGIPGDRIHCLNCKYDFTEEELNGSTTTG